MLYAAVRIVKFSWQSIWRNFWLSLITVSTIVVTLTTVSVILALQIGLEQIIRSVEKRIDLSVYLHPAVTDNQADSLVTVIKAMPGVSDIILVSKEQALENYKQRAEESPELLVPLSAIGENPFGAAIIIKADEPSVYGAVIEELKKPQYSELIDGQKRGYEENRLFIDSFSSFTDKVRFSGLILILIFAVVAAILIFNAIRVAIYTQRDEIAVMKLVGASNWFVRSPFLAEIVIYGLAAIAISAALFMLLLFFVQPQLSNYFGGEVDIFGYFRENGLTIFAVEFAVVTLLNIIAGSIALRRYLRV